MDSRLNGELLSTLIVEKRKATGLGLREAAAQAGIGFSTLSRLERDANTKPDLDTLERVAAWLGVGVGVLFAKSETVEAHLRARKRLSSATAHALRELIVLAREQFRRAPDSARTEATSEDSEVPEEAADEPLPSHVSWEETARGIRENLGLQPDERLEPFDVHIVRVARVEATKVQAVPSEVRRQLLEVGHSEWSAATIPMHDAKLDWLIVLNDAHTIERQRATLMEEYCHVLLGHEMSQISAQEGLAFRDYRREQEAEAFYVGAAALVPESQLRRRVAAREDGDAIAKHYGVSRELVEYRIKRLGLWYAYQLGLRRQP
jgi:transcriptional regulator with XRE-family HTH domain